VFEGFSFVSMKIAKTRRVYDLKREILPKAQGLRALFLFNSIFNILYAVLLKISYTHLTIDHNLAP